MSLYSLWYASLSLGAAVAGPAFESLNEFAQSALGPDAGYYQLEALSAAFSTYAQAHNTAGSFEAFNRLEKLPFYLSLLNGHVRVTRFILGYRCDRRHALPGIARAARCALLSHCSSTLSCFDAASPMCMLLPIQCCLQWDTGRMRTALETLARIMPLISATEHPPSIAYVSS